MIQRAKKPPKVYTFVCDGCPSEFLETEHYFYDRAMSAFRDAKWVTVSVPGGKYQQFCPGCAKQMGVD